MTYNNNTNSGVYINNAIATFASALEREDFSKEYPVLSKVCTPLEKPNAEIIGRDMRELKEGLHNAEKPNIMLLGEPGSGKTAFVQGFAASEDGSSYLILVVNIEKFMTDALGNKDAQIANGLVDLIADVKKYSYNNDIIVALFIDEFHSIIEFSNAAVQKLKPILEEAQRYGFRIIGATTFEEYDKFIASDKALDQRFNRINLPELHRDVVVQILQKRAIRHNVLDLCDPNIFKEVYNVSKQVEPSKSQPRASVDIFNNIIGSVTKKEVMQKGKIKRYFYEPHELKIFSEYIISRPILNRVIRRTYNIDIDNDVSMRDVRQSLYGGLLGQDLAISEVIDGVQNLIVGFVDHTRPKFSFLSTGSTGVGKTELAKLLSESLHIPLKRFDMSRFSDSSHATEFADQLALAAWSNPNAYILIDEIEKASREVVNILLQVLDDARLAMANNPNRIASFSGTIINLTTNVGSEIYQDFKSFSSSNLINVDIVYQSLVNSPKFETAVLGRIDSIIPFMPLSDEIMGMIVRKYLEETISVNRTPNREFYISDDIYKYIVQDKTSRDTEFGGARDAKRQVRKHVISKISNYLCNEAERECPIVVYVSGDPRFNNLKQANHEAGKVEVEECHDITVVNTYVNYVEQKLNKKFVNKGLFVPKHISLKNFSSTLIGCAQKGFKEFKTYMYIDKVLIQCENNNYFLMETGEYYDEHLKNMARIEAQREKDEEAMMKEFNKRINDVKAGVDITNKNADDNKIDAKKALSELETNANK